MQFMFLFVITLFFAMVVHQFIYICDIKHSANTILVNQISFLHTTCCNKITTGLVSDFNETFTLVDALSKVFLNHV